MDEQTKKELFKIFRALEDEALSLNHYELAATTGYGTPDIWKQFLIDPEVSAYIKQETDILLQTELRKLSRNASESKSVGQAQLINALGKISEDTSTKEGPIFIYTYVPLTPQQEQADNIRKEPYDLFLKRNNYEEQPAEFSINIDEEEF